MQVHAVSAHGVSSASLIIEMFVDVFFIAGNADVWCDPERGFSEVGNICLQSFLDLKAETNF